ncbi:MAG: hypothetical protein A2Y10_14785 [Planctomycetes bacterium GWF2_41_51]|nr:MAG: hypothetical protein A2Y10_14785 [Planctomycetes bacterium GWF2_41_51]HBG28991.1 hypothetical protein [Phycisphaerales bacterium]
MITNWKKICIAILVVFLIFQRKKIWDFIDDCRIRELFIDSFDYIWRLPQGLRFMLLSAFVIWIGLMVFKYLMKGGGQ